MRHHSGMILSAPLVTLEVAGRAIGHRHARLVNSVKTRIGAGILYNVTWLGGIFRDRGKENESSIRTPPTNGTQVASKPPNNVTSVAMLHEPMSDYGADWSLAPGIADVEMPLAGTGFPFGMWDDAPLQRLDEQLSS